MDNAYTGRTLEYGKTLEESGVEAGHSLSLIRQVVAGGGPEIPAQVLDKEVWKTALRYQLTYSIAGLALGVICVFGGLVLFVQGVTGSTSWTANVLGLESNISDAAPGAVLFLVGLFVVWSTRFSPKVKQ